MKGFALLVGALLGAALLYVTTAVGGQQAGPSRAEFNALKKQVGTLKKHDAAVQVLLSAGDQREAPQPRAREACCDAALDREPNCANSLLALADKAFR